MSRISFYQGVLFKKSVPFYQELGGCFDGGGSCITFLMKAGGGDPCQFFVKTDGGRCLPRVFSQILFAEEGDELIIQYYRDFPSGISGIGYEVKGISNASKPYLNTLGFDI